MTEKVTLTFKSDLLKVNDCLSIEHNSIISQPPMLWWHIKKKLWK